MPPPSKRGRGPSSTISTRLDDVFRSSLRSRRSFTPPLPEPQSRAPSSSTQSRPGDGVGAQFTTPPIGIHLGTTSSSVSVFHNGRVVLISDAAGAKFIPSVIGFKNNRRVIGDPARLDLVSNPTNTFFNVKRLVGLSFEEDVVQEWVKLFPFQVISERGKPKVILTYDSVQRISRGTYRTYRRTSVKKTLFPEALLAMILGKMKSLADIRLPSTPRHAVISVPTTFNLIQREAIRDAAKVVGLNVLSFINAPTAIALAHAVNKDLRVEEHSLIVHMGGGSLDVSVVSFKEGRQGRVAVNSSRGDTHLGGEDFVAKVMTHFLTRFQTEHGEDLRTQNVPLARLRRASARVVEELGRGEHSRVILNSLIRQMDFTLTLTRTAFQELVQDLVDKLINIVTNTVDDSGVSRSDISEILVGGEFSSLPVLHSSLRQLFSGKEVKEVVEPHLGVAAGAGILGAVLQGERTLPNRRVPRVVLKEKTTLCFGVKMADGTMTTLVKNGETIPVKKTLRFKAEELGFSHFSEDGSKVNIQLYEGKGLEPKGLARDNVFLTEFEVQLLPPSTSSESLFVEVTLEVDGRGRVVAEGCGVGSLLPSPRRGSLVKVDVGQVLRDRLSPAQMERMIEEEEGFQREGVREEEKEEVRLRLTNTCQTLKRKCEEVGGWLLSSSAASGTTTLLVRKEVELKDLCRTYANTPGIRESESETESE